MLGWLVRVRVGVGARGGLGALACQSGARQLFADGHARTGAYVRIKVTLLINHYNKNKLANYFQNFNSACRFLMITY